MHLDFQIHWRRTITIGMTMVVTSISAVLFIVATSSIPLLGKRSKKYELGPTMLLWRVGVGESGNSQNLLETITPGKLGSRDIWRVTTYPSGRP